jgi:hypothetical protein
MTNSQRQRGWAAVKARLGALSSSALVGVLGDLYRASPENRRFLHARFLGAETEIERYRKLIADAVYPDPFSRRPVRIGEAQKTIRQYRRATGTDIAGVVDLTLTFIEAGTEQSADLGYGDEQYFGALERALDSIGKVWVHLSQERRQDASVRIQRIAARAASIGWGYGDYVQDFVALVAKRQR